MIPKVAIMNSFLDDTKSLGQCSGRIHLWMTPIMVYGTQRLVPIEIINYLSNQVNWLGAPMEERGRSYLIFFIHQLTQWKHFLKNSIIINMYCYLKISDVNFMFLAYWFMLLHKCDILSILTHNSRGRSRSLKQLLLKIKGTKNSEFFFSENIKFSRRLSVRAQC